MAKGRLHPVRRGIYVVGRPELTQYGVWMAAALSCGDQAALSHESAAALWGIRRREGREIDVSVPANVNRERHGIAVHRRDEVVMRAVTRRHGIPVTSPLFTLIDLAARLPAKDVEAAVNEADKLDLIDPETLRSALEKHPGRPGVPALRKLLDRCTFTLTDTELERLFLPIARKAGLPLPETQRWINGGRVDFYWPDLGLVVETDGLRYHRTPSQQAADRLRDQKHAAAGLTPLRFTHAQVKFDRGHVQATLAAVARRL